MPLKINMKIKFFLYYLLSFLKFKQGAHTACKIQIQPRNQENHEIIMEFENESFFTEKLGNYNRSIFQ